MLPLIVFVVLCILNLASSPPPSTSSSSSTHSHSETSSSTSPRFPPRIVRSSFCRLPWNLECDRTQVPVACGQIGLEEVAKLSRKVLQTPVFNAAASWENSSPVIQKMAGLWGSLQGVSYSKLWKVELVGSSSWFSSILAVTKVNWCRGLCSPVFPIDMYRANSLY